MREKLNACEETAQQDGPPRRKRANKLHQEPPAATDQAHTATAEKIAAT